MNNLEDEVYYRIYYFEPKDYVTIVCMQWFDESDYIKENFYTDRFQNVLSFRTGDDAKQWLNINIQHDKIDPKYLYKSCCKYKNRYVIK